MRLLRITTIYAWPHYLLFGISRMILRNQDKVQVLICDPFLYMLPDRSIAVLHTVRRT
jgi:hypothetical protein